MLKDLFIKLVVTYAEDLAIAETLWKEIETSYGSKKRYYHNLLHLESLIAELEQCKNEVQDRDTILFSIFYHDIVYNVLNNDNEEKSAAIAVARLADIHLSNDKIARCKEQVLATKAHNPQYDNDANFLVDADLSILGKPPEKYDEYCRQIRKEYSIYPDLVYKPGRKKVIQHFLNMHTIFKTKFFQNTYERQARENLSRELCML